MATAIHTARAAVRSAKNKRTETAPTLIMNIIK